ncbi:hypothetical protein VZT92_017098 [Zoarces viviparus]|uniref:Protein kinase domain-containing protein n=1 Tax=Zoarces viviparus TaxID=48416 RepID=A0AAW1EQ72_ZOAVI
MGNGLDSAREIAMLKAVAALDPVKANVAQFLENFQVDGQTCLVFEMLDRSLLQLFEETRRKPLSLSMIRPIAQQLLTAFDALKGIGVVHSDLKIDNVMLADHPGEPFRVKLIDFGASFYTFENVRGHLMQPLGYRAPEVVLGLPVSEAIDMWGLGCMLLSIYHAAHPFSIRCQYQYMRDIVDTLGQPADHLLSDGYFTNKFFNFDSPAWCLKTKEEYQCGTGIEPQIRKMSFKSLDDLITLDTEKQESIELKDQRAFVRLLKSLLHMDPEKRITPEKALQQPFITMAHLMDDLDTSYVTECVDKMQVCPTGEPEKELLSDNEASAPPCPGGADSAAFCSCHDDITNTPSSIDGAAAAGVIVESGSAVPLVSHGAAGPAEETPAADGSPDEGPPFEVKESWLTIICKLFGKAITPCLQSK